MDDYALIIGINDYPNFRPLGGAVNDAHDFYDWVTSPAGGNVPAANCRFVESNPNPPRPLQDDIDDAILSIRDQIGASDARRFYFYFSGHGVGETYSDTAGCLSKWSDKYRRAGLSIPAYSTLIAQSGKFLELAFFLDCCRVRLIEAGGNGPIIGWPRPADKTGLTRVFTAYATEFNSLAYESLVGGDDLNRLRGYFTRALLAGLRGGAAIASGGVPASALKSYIEKWTPILADDNNQKQTPQVDNGFDTVNEPVFGAAKPIANVRLTFAPERQGEIIVEDGDLNEVRRGDAATGPWDLAIKPGLAVAHESAGGTEKTLRILPTKGVLDVSF